MPTMTIAGNVKRAAVLKARLDDARNEETWHVPLNNLLRKCKIPTSGMHHVSAEIDDIIEDSGEFEDKCVNVLVIKIIRDSIKDKKRAKTKQRRR